MIALFSLHYFLCTDIFISFPFKSLIILLLCLYITSAPTIKDAIVGKHFEEGDELYVDVSEKHYKFIEREFKDKLTEDEFETLYELVEIKRKKDPDWGKFGLFE